MFVRWKIKRKGNTASVLNKIEDARQFVKYFVNLVECNSITYDEFLNSEFKLEVDKNTQKIYNKYFFDNIPKIKKENN